MERSTQTKNRPRSVGKVISFKSANKRKKALVKKLRNGNERDHKLSIVLAGCKAKNRCRLDDCPVCLRRKLLGKKRHENGEGKSPAPAAEMEFHPLAEIFPLVTEAELNDLTQDIAKSGLHDPIVKYEGKILDGRCRYLACKAANVEPKFINYSGNGALGFVVSRNLLRRHLTEGQRAMVAARVASLEVGANQHSAGTPIGEASKRLNVSERSISRAKEVVLHGVPELTQAVEGGKLAVSAAAQISRLDKSEQRQALNSKCAPRRKRRVGNTPEVGPPAQLDVFAENTAADGKGLMSATSTGDDGIPSILDRRPLAAVDQEMLNGLVAAWSATRELWFPWPKSPLIVRERFIEFLRTAGTSHCNPLVG